MTINNSRWSTKKILFYLVSWVVVSFILLFISYDYRFPVFPQWLSYMIITVVAFPLCYYTAYKLIPKYLYRRKIGRFIGLIFLLAIANALVTYLFAGVEYALLTGTNPVRSLYYFFTILIAIYVVDIILVAIACIIKIISDRYYMEQEMQQIAEEKLTTELNFLRSQINPHFLFNVMNTIYFQIEKTNTQARLSVEKFSEMLRYQLYECTTDKIQIGKELNYIKNYVAIQTLRMEHESDIRLNIQEPIGDFWIAPFLILPIVENAFKHVSSFKDAGRNKIHVTLKAVDGWFYIEAINSYEREYSGKHLLQSGGLGIQNLKRRLELLYNENYELSIDDTGETYTTTLKLKYDN